MMDDRNYPDFMLRDDEEERTDALVAVHGTPRPQLDPLLREYMHGVRERRAAERADAAEADDRYYLLTGRGRHAAAIVAARQQEAHEAYIREHHLEETHAEVVRALAAARAPKETA
jgi:hypothetical protein